MSIDDQPLKMKTNDNKTEFLMFITAPCNVFSTQNMDLVRNCLSDKSAAIIIHTNITNKLDYCNSQLYGLSDFQIQRLIFFRILLTKYKMDSYITSI